jgi:hypothetical protein
VFFVTACYSQRLGGISIGAPVRAPAYVVFDGDSMSLPQTGTNDQSYHTFSLEFLSYTGLNSWNVAIGGETLQTMLADFSAHVGSLYVATAPFVVVVEGGTNDIRLNGTAPATIYGYLQSYVTAVHALGSNAKVAVTVNLLQCDIFENGTWNSSLQTLNNDIIANWNVPQGSGGLGADAIVNIWANPTIGPDSYTSSAFCNSTYSPDGQHPTLLSMGIMGSIEGAAVQPLLPP